MEETFNIGKYFTYKDKQLVPRRSNVVHKITSSYGGSYIGQRKRNLQFRIKEHKPGLFKNDTDVSEHLIENPDHRIDFNNVNSLAHSNNWRKLLIKETLLIRNQKPSLNIDQSSVTLYLFNK